MVVSMQTVNNLVETIEKKKCIVNSMRPINKITLLKIRDNFRIKGMCNSLKIEGSHFSERETRVLLETLSYSSSYNKEAIEMLNLNSAVKFVEDNLHRNLTMKLMNEIHRLCMFNVLPSNECGRFRNNGVVITNSKYKPPHSSKVKPLIKESIERYNSNAGDLLAILRFKHDFTHIHPYFDGNGRVSRLLLDFLLLKNKYVPVIIDAKDKSTYYSVLEYADLYMDYRRYYYFMLKQLDNTYNLYINTLGVASEK